MGKKGFATLAAVLFFLTGISADSYRIVPNYGHMDRVLNLGWDRQRDALLSLGEDNYCLAVDLKDRRVLNRIPLKGVPVTYALNSVYPEIAVITERDEAFLMTLLNWQTGRILFETAQREIPFFLEYSRSGEFLLRGDGTIRMLAHDTGAAVDGPEDITELLTYGYLGGSEKTFMGYSPSGTLFYYDRFSSQIKGQANTEEDLTDLTVLKDDVRLMTGRRDNRVFLIDRQTGETLDTLDKDSILSYYCRSDNGEVTILEQSGSALDLSTYGIRRNRFSRISEKPLTSESGISRAVYMDGTYILGTETGDILSLSRRGSAPGNLLSAHPLILDRLALSENRLLLRNGSNLTIWESPFFEKEGLSPNYLLNITSRELTLPLDNAEISAFNGQGVIWQPDEKVKYPWYFLKDGKELEPLFEPESQIDEEKSPVGFKKEVTNGLKELSFLGDLETVVDTDKSCRIFRLLPEEAGFGREELYSYTHPSLETAAMVSDNQLAIGTNTYYGGRNNISVTNIYTGESVPISDERTIVTQFLPDREGNGFFSLGFTEKDGSSKAVVKYHDFSRLFENSETVLEFSEPTTNQCRMTQGGDGNLYVSSPEGSWYSTGAIPPESSASLDRIYSKGGCLYLIDRDHSLAILEEDSLKLLARVYFFREGGWMAVGGNDRHYFYSSRARELFNVYKIKD